MAHCGRRSQSSGKECSDPSPELCVLTSRVEKDAWNGFCELESEPVSSGTQFFRGYTEQPF